VVLWRAAHSPRIFVKQVPFVTSAGNVDRVVTPLCVFRLDAGHLVLDTIHPGVSREQLAESTGFAIANLPEAPVTREPTHEELAELERIDPDKVRRVEFSRRG
jgi:glutaconate CoA-transferase subunit B